MTNVESEFSQSVDGKMIKILVLQGEPNDGDLCVECWKNILAFDQFCIHIETIHDLINKTKESITAEPVKIEIDEQNVKHEDTFVNDDWSFHNDLDGSDHNSNGKFDSYS